MNLKSYRWCLSALAAVFLAGAVPACASPRVRFYSHHLLRGSIVQVSGKIAYVSVGRRDRARTGQRFTVYRLSRCMTFQDRCIHSKHYVGLVMIRQILDDNFAVADILSGRILRYDIAEVKVPEILATGYASRPGKSIEFSGGAL
ncbi:MAG: hypothetical protein RIF32_03485 [Leptospirales bacterium]|jgi:hypothetical protein